MYDALIGIPLDRISNRDRNHATVFQIEFHPVYIADSSI